MNAIAEEKTERILLIINEDNTVLRLTKILLENERFTVLSADSGHDGLEQFAAHIDRIDLVVCDANILNERNRNTISRLLALKPDIQIILCANAEEVQVCKEELRSPDVVVIMKPYTTLTIVEYAKNFFQYRNN
jgi:DNA-binding NtrC family response regulator